MPRQVVLYTQKYSEKTRILFMQIIPWQIICISPFNLSRSLRVCLCYMPMQIKSIFSFIRPRCFFISLRDINILSRWGPLPIWHVRHCYSHSKQTFFVSFEWYICRIVSARVRTSKRSGRNRGRFIEHHSFEGMDLTNRRSMHISIKWSLLAALSTDGIQSVMRQCKN